MSEAIELFKKNGISAGVFYCSECRIVHPTQDRAAWCHGERLCACGAKVTQGYFQGECNECRWKKEKAEESAKEAERFEKATKVTVADYEGEESDYEGEMVYCGDSYYESVEEAIDQFIEGQEPEYVWACKNQGIPRIDLEDVTCNLLENMWEDAELSDLHGVEELSAALDAFNEANKSIKVWVPDYSIAILVKEAEL